MHEELVNALRCCVTDYNNIQSRLCNKCQYAKYADGQHGCENKLKADAADALEAAEKRIDGLQKLVDINTERCEALRKQLREAHENYEKHLNELEAQMPKEGEWIVTTEVSDDGAVTSYINCSRCGFYWREPKHGRVFKRCPNCGARMRVK